jgi:hypothetical protein
VASSQRPKTCRPYSDPRQVNWRHNVVLSGPATFQHVLETAYQLLLLSILKPTVPLSDSISRRKVGKGTREVICGNTDRNSSSYINDDGTFLGKDEDSTLKDRET